MEQLVAVVIARGGGLNRQFELTPCERKILELRRAGKTRREMAEAMGRKAISGSEISIGELTPGGTPILLSFNGTIFQIVNDSLEAGGSQLLVFSRTANPWTVDANNGPGALCATAEACWPATPTIPTAVVGETPNGLINGTNEVFYLAHTPRPLSSVAVYLLGVRLTNCATCQFYAYVSGAYGTGALHFNPGSVPKSANSVQVDYQY